MSNKLFLFKKNGIQICGKVYSEIQCKSLLKKIKKTRNFQNIFLAKKKIFKPKAKLNRRYQSKTRSQFAS